MSSLASPTATDPPLCGVCPNPATITCTVCNNIKYCSAACQQRDFTQHNALCVTFREFQVRPSPNHFRCIYFPAYDTLPRFVWISILGERGSEYANLAELEQYVTRKAMGIQVVTAHHGIIPTRKYKHSMVVDYSLYMFSSTAPVNRCLRKLVGPEAECFREGFVCRGYKNTHNRKREDGGGSGGSGGSDGQSRERGAVPLDLDTTSLGPLVAFFKKSVLTPQSS